MISFVSLRCSLFYLKNITNRVYVSYFEVPDDARLSSKSVVVLQNLCQKVSIIILPCMLPVYTMINGLLANKNIGSMCLV